MAKKIKCTLVMHGIRSEINMGEFESISKAKKYVSECWDRPYTIIKQNNNKYL